MAQNYQKKILSKDPVNNSQIRLINFRLQYLPSGVNLSKLIQFMFSSKLIKIVFLDTVWVPTLFQHLFPCQYTMQITLWIQDKSVPLGWEPRL